MIIKALQPSATDRDGFESAKNMNDQSFSLAERKQNDFSSLEKSLKSLAINNDMTNGEDDDDD